jgi:hypothetical protein
MFGEAFGGCYALDHRDFLRVGSARSGAVGQPSQLEVGLVTDGSVQVFRTAPRRAELLEHLGEAALLDDPAALAKPPRGGLRLP